ncbi:MAG: hypothetical protein HYX94_00520 [Chloroflexi bacterium]|nr:hypothetical protein [Chloroflexota bacterium]
MSTERITARDPRVQGAVRELEGLITANYPDATFEVAEGEDPEGVYLTAIVDTDDLTAILETVGDRLVDMQVEQGLPLYVVPTRPLKRVLAGLQQPRPRRRPRIELDDLIPPVQP